MLIQYEEKLRTDWERFVLKESINGTFFQTRNFLDYHPKGKFNDNSLLFMKGNNIVAVVPANLVEKEGSKKLVSHMGTSFGGIILGSQYNKISDIRAVFEALEEYMSENHISEIFLKQTSDLYAKENSKILEYFYHLYHYNTSCEMGFYGKLNNYDQEPAHSFHASRRRGYKKSLGYNLTFRQLSSDSELQEFYMVLCNNMNKFKETPVHTLADLGDFKNKRIKENIGFYGVFYKNAMIAGSMVFYIDKKVFHTHYLATKQESLFAHPSEFLYWNLINTAKEQGFENIAFGNCTLNGGKVLHDTLAQFKEGFGTEAYLNCSFYKTREDT